MTAIVLSFRGIEQGIHSIQKSLIYSMRKAFLEHAVVELVSGGSWILKGRELIVCKYSGHTLITIVEVVFSPMNCNRNILLT